MLVDCDPIQFCHYAQELYLEFYTFPAPTKIIELHLYWNYKTKSQQPLYGEGEEMMGRMLYVWEQGTSPLKHHSLD